METTLYAPIKAFLTDLGYDVKGEVGGCDLLGLRAGEPPVLVVCELKLSFTLELVLQGVERAAVADEVWLAARLSRRGKGRESDPRFRNLCRSLGFGLLGVSEAGAVALLLGPDAGFPRKNPKKRSRLAAEHRRRRGDPAVGGGSRMPIMTAYRQQALACAAALTKGPLRMREVSGAVPEAPKILHRNVYGWFLRLERGVYELTEIGHAALARWPRTEGAPAAGAGDIAGDGGPSDHARSGVDEGHLSREE